MKSKSVEFYPVHIPLNGIQKEIVSLKLYFSKRSHGQQKKCRNRFDVLTSYKTEILSKQFEGLLRTTVFVLLFCPPCS